jgi:hypothetical protein
MSYVLGSALPITVTLIAAAGDRPAVTATFNAQPSPLSLRAARRAAIAEMKKGEMDVLERAGDAFTAAIIRHNLIGWSGIGDEGDQVIEPTHDREIHDAEGVVTGIELGTISRFLAEPRLVEAADREYVLPWTKVDAEKNGLSPSLAGTSAGATPEPDTATSSVTPAASADAAKTTAARRVRTKSTKPGRTKAKPSGS